MQQTREENNKYKCFKLNYKIFHHKYNNQSNFRDLRYKSYETSLNGNN